MNGMCGLIPALCAVIGVGQATASGIAGFVSSTWYQVCQSFADAASAMLQAFARSFEAIPSVNLGSAGIRSIYSLSLGIAAIVAALLLLGQVIRTAFTHDGTGLATALTGLAKTALAALLTLAVASAALAASNTLTDVIITSTLKSDAELTRRLGGLLAGATVVGSPGLSAALLLTFGILGILLVVVLWFELLLRNAAIAVLISTAPIAAAGQLSETTRAWWTKLVAATIQLIILKPVIALVFAIGLKLVGQATDIETLLEGMLVLILAVFAWPAVARFFTFANVSVAGSAGLAALVGFAAGRSTAPVTAPTGIAPSEFSQRTEQRTMSRMAGDAADGSALGMAAAAQGASVAGVAGTALGAAQRGINALTSRMEQTAGHAGMQGANPFAQPAGTPRYHQGGWGAAIQRPASGGPADNEGPAQTDDPRAPQPEVVSSAHPVPPHGTYDESFEAESPVGSPPEEGAP